MTYERREARGLKYPGELYSHSRPLSSARQHASYGDCLEVKRLYYQNSSVLDCVTQCSRSTAHLCEQFLQVQQIGFVMGLCVEAVALSCIIVAWWNGSGEIQTWSRRPTVFLQSFDTVGLVIWSVKIVPEMTYNVLSGTLSLYSTTIVTVASRSSLLALKQVDCTRNCKPDSPTKSLLAARPGRLHRKMLELMTVRERWIISQW